MTPMFLEMMKLYMLTLSFSDYFAYSCAMLIDPILYGPNKVAFDKF